VKKVFYIIPLYNSEDTISRCLFSIYSSKYHLEIIVINDNSQDTSELVVKSIKNKLSYKLHLINNKNNIGISRSLNKGIEMAISKNADYLMRLDSDDFNKKGRTDFQIDYLESNPKKMICTGNADLLIDGTITESKILSLQSIFENQFRPFTNLIGSLDLHPTFCMRIKPFKNLGMRYGILPLSFSLNYHSFFMREGMEDLLLINLFIFYYGYGCICRHADKKLIIYSINNSGLTPVNKKLRNSLLKEIFRVNQLIYNRGISEKNNLTTIYKLAKSISYHQYRNQLKRSIFTFLGFLILNINFSNMLYKLLFFPVLFFMTPRLIIQSLKKV